MATADTTIIDRLDKLATLVAALQDIVERQGTELAALRHQAQQVAPPCRACGERVLGYAAPPDRVDRDKLAALGIDPESGHRLRCGAVLTERTRQAMQARP